VEDAYEFMRASGMLDRTGREMDAFLIR
jgi:hypothetical protein